MSQINYFIFGIIVMSGIIAIGGCTNQEGYVQPLDSTDQEKYLEETKETCESTGATYRKFASSCRDQCGVDKTEFECKSPESYGCDCGPDKCWNGRVCEFN